MEAALVIIGMAVALGLFAEWRAARWEREQVERAPRGLGE